MLSWVTASPILNIGTWKQYENPQLTTQLRSSKAIGYEFGFEFGYSCLLDHLIVIKISHISYLTPDSYSPTLPRMTMHLVAITY